MPTQSTTRPSRGTYASLICGNCSSRKIKCRLPPGAGTLPLGSPQPGSSACQRCQDLGLQCVVRPTTLGRPASRRKQSEMRSRSQPSLATSATTTNAVVDGTSDSVDIGDYLLTELSDNESPPQNAANVPRASRDAVHNSMVSPSHLMAAVLAKDRNFGVTASCTTPYVHQALPTLISNGMAALLDEHLVWHRFYLPLIPTLVSLRQALVSEATPSALASVTLFALLSLIALDTPSNRLRDDPHLRDKLKSALSYYGEEFLLTLPATRDSLAVLTMLFYYKPTGLATSQRTASLAVKSWLYMTLAYRVAKKIGLQDAVTRLQSHTSSHIISTAGAVAGSTESFVVDALQWCQILIEDALADGLIHHFMPAMKQTLRRVDPIMATISEFVESHQSRSSTIYHFASTKSLIMGIQHFVMAYECSNDLEQLGRLINSYSQCSSQLQNTITDALSRSPNSVEGNASEAMMATPLVIMQIEHHEVLVFGIAIYFALLSSMRRSYRSAHTQRSSTDSDIGAREAVQMANDVIDHFKAIQFADMQDLMSFLKEHGDARDALLERILGRFVHTFAHGEWPHDTAPWLPPPRRLAVDLLFCCKTLVDNSALRMKGWNVLHPNVEEHLRLFTACAEKLEGMACSHSRSVNEAFADGCLYAACAKLIRSLHRIVTGWKANLVVAAKDNEHHATQSAEHRNAAADVNQSLPDFDVDDMLAQWSDWPQADLADLMQIFPDDLDFS